MGALGRPDPTPYVEEADLENLAADLGAGWHTAASLYRWYVGLMTEFEREPVSQKMFGLALREARWNSSVRRMDGRPTRGWMVSRPWVRRGEARLAEQLAASKA